MACLPDSGEREPPCVRNNTHLGPVCALSRTSTHTSTHIHSHTHTHTQTHTHTPNTHQTHTKHTYLHTQLERERHTSSGFLKAQRQPSAPAASLKPQPSSPLPQQPSPAVSAVPGSGPATQEVKQAGSGRPYLFVTDFDKTLVDFDAGERVSVCVCVCVSVLLATFRSFPL